MRKPTSRRRWRGQEAVQQADGGGVLGQEPAPVVEGPVRGDAQRAALVGGGGDAEQELGAGVVERGDLSTTRQPRPTELPSWTSDQHVPDQGKRPATPTSGQTVPYDA